MQQLYDNNGDSFAELNYSEEYFLDYSKHSHNSFSITVFRVGEVEVEFHTKEEELVSFNQIIIFNPNQVHQTKSEIKKTKDYFTLHVDSKWCKDIQTKIFGLQKEFVSVQNIIDDKLLAQELIDVFHNTLLNDNLNNKNLEKLIFSILEKYTIFNKEEKQTQEHLLCKKVEEYILNNIKKQISIEDISKSVAYNESYVTRVFKKKYGLTPHAFLINKRVQKAKEKLLNSNIVSLSELSNDIGFYDQSHFSKVFKRAFATTPNKYRSKKKES